MFVHLHVHTEYSLLDGAARIKEVVKTAAKMNQPALAITDHGVMFGVIDFFKACEKAGVKPVIGCEVYVAPRRMSDRVAHVDDQIYHLVLLAENMDGYRNLLRLVSLGFTEGFYYKPRLDKETLSQYSNGIIALSGCLAGEINSHILSGKLEKAKQSVIDYTDIFGRNNFYLEMQDHGMPEQKTANAELIRLGREAGISLVATNDVHYIKKEHAEIQDILLCIQTGKTVDDPTRMKFESNELYLKSAAEMQDLFRECPEAVNNTLEIAERCVVKIQFGENHLPEYKVPQNYDADTYLRDLAYRGLKERFGEVVEQYRDRIEYELGVIKQMGFSSYFLIVQDFIQFARQNNIPVGPGRGSAAGSLVSYCLRITDLDPLRYGLLFERFLNPERVTMPDVDVDICYERRGEVINYVSQKYGEDRVAQIATFGTMAARAAIRDVGRTLQMPYNEVDRVAKLVPTELHITIEKALHDSTELKELYDGDEGIRKLIDTASLLEGMPRHFSTHAAGLVITHDPLTHYLPLYKSPDGPVTTQFAKDQVEELGLLKMDLLGLRTLTVISDAVRLIEENRGIKVNIGEIPLDDPATFSLLCRGESTGVFQLESSGMKSLLKDLRPEVFEEVIALVALYRPGPLGSGMVEDFIKSKHKEKKVVYLDPKLEPILKDTYGVILYQEQVMRIASDLAGFTLGEADLLRRAMGKKKPKIISGLRSQFIEGAVKNGVGEDVAGQVFDLMEFFAGYGFNKSHSAAYAMVAYQTAYLKATYPAEYMAALITSVMDNTDKVAVYLEECRRLKIKVLPPDVNKSKESFSVFGDSIRFGLLAIKNVGAGPVEAIIEARSIGGPFKSYSDFCSRLDARVINRRTLESLIKSGALDSLGCKRAQMMAAIDDGLSLAYQSTRERGNGQLSLLDFWGEDAKSIVSLNLPDVPEYAQGALLAMEKESLGFYLSGHPLAEYRYSIRQSGAGSIADLLETSQEREVLLGGMIASIKKINTRRGDLMAVGVLEDLSGNIQVVFFPRVYQKYKDLIKPDSFVLIRGRTNTSGDVTKVLCDELQALTKKISGELYIKFDNPTLDLVNSVQLVLKSYPGESVVYLYYTKENKLARASREYWVDLSAPVLKELRELLGVENVKVKDTVKTRRQEVHYGVNSGGKH